MFACKREQNINLLTTTIADFLTGKSDGNWSICSTIIVIFSDRKCKEQDFSNPTLRVSQGRDANEGFTSSSYLYISKAPYFAFSDIIIALYAYKSCLALNDYPECAYNAGLSCLLVTWEGIFVTQVNKLFQVVQIYHKHVLFLGY